MGVSGILLKKKEKFHFDKLIYDIRNAANKANVICLDGMEFEKNQDGIYEYMKLNLDDIFYDELKWHYTFNDIQKIAKSPIFDPEWCYKNPHE